MTRRRPVRIISDCPAFPRQTKCTRAYPLLSMQVMSILVCSIVLIANHWLLMCLKLPSITTSFLLSVSKTRLYKSMFFTLILLPSIPTFHGKPFAALCITLFSSTRQYILDLSPTNSVIRCQLCSPLKMGPGSFLLKLRKDVSEGNLLLSTSCL